MSDQDVFNTKPKEEEIKKQPEQLEANPNDLLDSIRTEDGRRKYESLDQALQSIPHSQDHIKKLESENREYKSTIEGMQEQLKKIKTLEETVEALAAHKKQEEAPKETPQAATVSQEAVAEMVAKQLEGIKNQETAERNIATVSQKLTELYGSKVSEVVAETAKELGTTPEYLGELAKQNPQLVLKAFANNKPKSPGTITSSYHTPEVKNENGLEKPTKSLLSGASSKDQTEYIRQVKAHVYKDLGVQT